jgi:uncharacterized protein YjbI with pentapeptide repeats
VNFTITTITKFAKIFATTYSKIFAFTNFEITNFAITNFAVTNLEFTNFAITNFAIKNLVITNFMGTNFVNKNFVITNFVITIFVNSCHVLSFPKVFFLICHLRMNDFLVVNFPSLKMTSLGPLHLVPLLQLRDTVAKQLKFRPPNKKWANFIGIFNLRWKREELRRCIHCTARCKIIRYNAGGKEIKIKNAKAGGWTN